MCHNTNILAQSLIIIIIDGIIIHRNVIFVATKVSVRMSYFNTHVPCMMEYPQLGGKGEG